ncbi:hypothetical protein niasHT_018845 [Heterodera trifolii]|uniref:Uncharacterized protein n=1 Tax=Heterodera trifolii TaxID=157864 RepID=A0ABD2KXF3_9BILA
MDVQLNFLQHEPTANWLDYFLERKKLSELLRRKPIDRIAAISFCDQFVEQALVGERDLATMERNNSIEKDDFMSTHYKIEDLWLCALSCFAACDWDLSLLIKNSNVIRVGALLSRLIRWAFESDLSSQSRTLFAEEPFKFLNSFDRVGASRLFSGWLYARWILKIDLDGRFPVPPARPTVSNPYFSVDQSLLQAERLSQVTLEVRSRMGEAVNFLRRIVNDRRIGDDDKVEVPGMMCFFPSFDITTKKLFLPKANFDAETHKISWCTFRRKTMFDLMTAHFSAKHFQRAKHFLSKTLSCKTENEDLQIFSGDLLHIDENELLIYRHIFKMGDAPPLHKSRPTIAICHSDPLLNFVRQKAKIDKNNAKYIVKLLLSSGVCRISKHQLNRLRENEEARKNLIEEISAELLRFFHGVRCLSKSDSLRYVRLCGCVYFLCALLPGFVELLLKIATRLLEPPHSLRTRLLAVLPSVSVSQPPSDDYLKDFISSGPPLWTLLASFDFGTLYDTFAKHTSQLLISEQKPSPFCTFRALPGTK